MGLFSFFFYQKLESQMLLFGGKLWQYFFMCSCCFEIFTPYFLPQYTDQVLICSFLGGSRVMSYASVYFILKQGHLFSIDMSILV